MAAVELATAYISIVPSMKGVQGEVARQFGPVAKQSEAEGKKAGGRFSRGVKSGTAKLAAGLAGAFAAAKVADFAGDALAEARESQKVGKVTEQIIKSTGGAAKISASQMGDLAGSISAKVGMDDEAIQSGANLLLTFKKVRNEAGKGNDVFNRATKAAVDLSAAGFGSIESSSKMLGKALNDPIKGITALSRAGVTFTDQQKAMIGALTSGGIDKALIAMGAVQDAASFKAELKVNDGNVKKTVASLTKGWDKAKLAQLQMLQEGDHTVEAQKLIMKEVESQVGGVAEKSATAGEKMAVAWGNFKESIGTALIPVLDKFLVKGEKLTIWATENPGKLKGIGIAIAAMAGLIAAAWAVSATAAVASAGVQLVAGVKVIGGWVKQAAAATASGVTSARIWLMLQVDAAKAAAAHVVAGLKIVGSWIRQAAAATVSGAQTAAVWVMLQASAAKAAAIQIAAQVRMAASWTVGTVAMLAQRTAMVAAAVAAGVMTAAQWALNIALNANPIGLVIVAGVALAALFVLLWKRSDTFRKIVTGAWKAIQVGINLLWKYYLKPYLTAWRLAMVTVWKGIIYAKDRIIAGFGAIQRGVGRVKDAFGRAADGIKAVWSKVGGFIKAPIGIAARALNTFISGLDSLMGKVSGGKLGIDFRITGDVLGWKDGGYTGNKPASAIAGVVHGDEHVIRSPARRALESMRPGALDYMNKTGRWPGYKSGGRVVWPAKGTSSRHSGYPWATWAGDINQPGTADFGAPVRAYRDGKVAATNRWGHSYGNHIRINHPGSGSTLYAHLSQIAVRAGQAVTAGQQIGRVGNTGNSFGPHLHFEIMGGAAKIGGDSGGGGGGLMGMVTSALDKFNAVGKFNKLVGKLKGSLDVAEGSPIGQMLKKIPSRLRDGAWDWVKDKLSPFDTGGLAMGKGLMFKDTQRPERVLSPRQTQAFESAMAGGFGGGVKEVRLAKARVGIDDLGGYIEGIAQVVFDNGMAYDAQIGGM